MIISKTDFVDVLKLSTRAYNNLRRAKIHTVQDFLSFSPEDFIGIRNMGQKTLSELLNCLERIKTNDIIVVDKVEDSVSTPNITEPKTFIYTDGNRYIDIKIKDLGLSVRAYNCLNKESILYFSEIAFKNANDLLNIDNMGRVSISEIQHTIKNIKLVPARKNDKDEDYFLENLINEIYKLLNPKLKINAVEHYTCVNDIVRQYLENCKPDTISVCVEDVKLQKQLQSITYIYEKYEEFLLELIGQSQYGCTYDYIYEQTPLLLKDKKFISDHLSILLQQSKFITDNNLYVVNYPSFVTGATSLLKEREYDIILKRVQGLTLEECGTELNVTRERVRQIEAKAFRILNKTGAKFKEDVYSEIFNTYYLSADDFQVAFIDIQTYHYLALRYSKSNCSDEIEKLPLKNALEDETIPNAIKRQIEKAVYKNYVKIGNEYVPCTRADITNYVLRTFATEDITFSEFTAMYFTIIDDLGLNNEEKLSVMDRGYENRLAASNSVLWKRGKKLRYHKIENYDFEELLSVLDLNQYNNVEYSTLKFFNLYPDLMKDYDIRDEYELHNLLKKICNNKDYPLLNFSRMPNIEFGTADRDSQVLDLLLNLAPISNYDFALEYEKEYGVGANTVLANYMKNFDDYFHNGIYKIDAPMFPELIFNMLKEKLQEDIYFISDIKGIYKKEFPIADPTLLNPFSLKSLGFKVYSSYAINSRFSSATDYFHYLLTKDDVVNTSSFPQNIQQIIAYSSQLYKLKADYEIVEFASGKYISYRRLYQNGISKDMLNDYVKDVLKFVGEGKYFTINSVKEDGFYHSLDEYGFDDWFYSSLLVEHKSEISYIRIGGNKLFIKGKMNIIFEDFIENIVFNQENMSIDIYDLDNTLKSFYNINIDVCKLITYINNSSMFYDGISEKVYADYDVYYEEI